MDPERKTYSPDHAPASHPFFTPATVRELLAWYDAGAGSGSHLAETLGIPVSREVRALANILQCAKDSAEVQRMLAELAL